MKIFSSLTFIFALTVSITSAIAASSNYLNCPEERTWSCGGPNDVPTFVRKTKDIQNCDQAKSCHECADWEFPRECRQNPPSVRCRDSSCETNSGKSDDDFCTEATAQLVDGTVVEGFHVYVTKSCFKACFPKANWNNSSVEGIIFGPSN